MKKSTTLPRSDNEVEVIGIDLGDRMSHFVGLDSEGAVVSTGRVATTPAAMETQFAQLRPTLIAIETGTHSPWVSRLLTALGHHLIVANSRKLRLIYQNRRKNDRIDAEYLARLARLDPKLLSPVKHRAERDQRHLGVLRSRDTLVRTRSSLITHVRGVLKSAGLRVGTCSAEGFAKKARAVVPTEWSATLEPILRTIDQVSKEVALYDRHVAQLAKTHYPAAALVAQITGVGLITSVAFVATIGEAARFARSRTVAAWIGLTPGQDASGQQDPQMRITKEGDHYLRRLLVGCAHYILGRFGPDCDLRRHGLAMMERGGKNAKKRAVVAVARKLAVLMHRLWRTGEVYEPLYNAHRRAPAAA